MRVRLDRQTYKHARMICVCIVTHAHHAIDAVAELVAAGACSEHEEQMRETSQKRQRDNALQAAHVRAWYAQLIEEGHVCSCLGFLPCSVCVVCVLWMVWWCVSGWVGKCCSGPIAEVQCGAVRRAEQPSSTAARPERDSPRRRLTPTQLSAAAVATIRTRWGGARGTIDSNKHSGDMRRRRGR